MSVRRAEIELSPSLTPIPDESRKAPTPMTDPGMHHAQLFVEIGGAVILLALLARFASRWGFSAIPLYLLLGLAFGNGGLLPLQMSQNTIGTGAEIGVLLLLFMMGLECNGEELMKNLRFGLP